MSLLAIGQVVMQFGRGEELNLARSSVGLLALWTAMSIYTIVLSNRLRDAPSKVTDLVEVEALGSPYEMDRTYRDSSGRLWHWVWDNRDLATIPDGGRVWVSPPAKNTPVVGVTTGRQGQAVVLVGVRVRPDTRTGSNTRGRQS